MQYTTFRSGPSSERFRVTSAREVPVSRVKISVLTQRNLTLSLRCSIVVEIKISFVCYLIQLYSILLDFLPTFSINDLSLSSILQSSLSRSIELLSTAVLKKIRL